MGCQERFIENGKVVTRDCYSGRPAAPIQPPPQNGPGTELKKLLAGWPLRIVASPNCSCNARARQMDVNGCDWCEENIELIVGWLREEAGKRKLPYLDAAGRLLVRRAIALARRKIDRH